MNRTDSSENLVSVLHHGVPLDKFTVPDIIVVRDKIMTHYKVVFYKGEDGYIIADCPTIPGCYSQGKTLKEAKKNIKEAIELCLECYKEDNKKIPKDNTSVAKIAVAV